MKISAYAYGAGPCCPYHGNQTRLLHVPDNASYPWQCPFCWARFSRTGRQHEDGQHLENIIEDGLLEALDWYLEHK